MSNSNGHRERILSRFENGGLKSFHDYEILELLLTFIFPRIDTKLIAKDLLKRFNSINSVLNSDPELLMTVEGMGKKSVSKLLFFRELIGYCLKEKQLNKCIINSRTDVEEYLRMYFGFRNDEYMASVFLNNSNDVLGIEELGEGTVNRCHVYPRKLFHHAFKYGAASIILAHNHPGGSKDPSISDWRLTKEVKSAGKVMDITLLDHIIITNAGTVSMREMKEWPVK